MYVLFSTFTRTDVKFMAAKIIVEIRDVQVVDEGLLSALPRSL